MILTQANVPYAITAREWKNEGFRDSYAWHKRIWEAFPGKPQAKRDFLTRLDDTGEHFRLLILSPEPPTRPDWCPFEMWESKTIDEKFFTHSHYQFSLLANPTCKRVIRNEDGSRKKNGRREPICKRPDLITWIQKKGTLHGFEINPEALKTIPHPKQEFYISKKKNSGTLTATEFKGILKVSDPDAFKNAALKGIGSARAFGFGMLCLIPIQS